MKRILVAVDSGPRAAGVLAAAVDLARHTGAKLRLLRAVEMSAEIPANVLAMPSPETVTGMLGLAKSDLTELVSTIPPELFEGAAAQVGVAWDAICTAAKEVDADLIVIGSHGYGVIDRLLGTTAAKVVNHADRSVYVVHDPHHQAA